MPRLLLGNRGRALYPPRNMAGAQRRAVPPTTAGATVGLFSRQSFVTLSIGILFGYLLLPMLLVQRLGFEGDITHSKTTFPARMNAFQVATISQRNNDNNDSHQQYSIPPSRQLDMLDAEVESTQKSVLRSAATIEPALTRIEQRVPDLPPSEDEGDAVDDGNKTPVDTSVHHEPSILTDRMKTIVEERDILSQQSLPTATTPYIMKTPLLPDHHRMKILVTGGAGFVGSHLVDKLMMQGHEVIVVDNFFTGQKKNIAHWLHHPNFSLVVHDVTEHIQLEVDQIYHLACPASPPHYQYNPVKTIKTSTMGTLNMLGLAKRVRARILLTSTSEIYGDPKVHPQHESYWGNVNTIGPRSCYDEGKRVAETMMYSYRNQNDVQVRVARIFNTFGPRMHPNDGRVVSNFIIQALQNKNMTVYGEGGQTRSFQYVSDLVEGLYALMNGGYDLPVNLGNPDEYSVRNFAEYIKEMTLSNSQVVFLPKSQDDPSQRRPNITTARDQLGWAPKVTVKEGLKETIAYFRRVLEEAGEIIPTGPGAAKPEA